MTTKEENLVDLIFKNFKNYKSKETELIRKYNYAVIVKQIFKYNMYNFSSLTLVLIITFIISLYFLYKVTSNSKN